MKIYWEITFKHESNLKELFTTQKQNLFYLKKKHQTIYTLQASTKNTSWAITLGKKHGSTPKDANITRSCELYMCQYKNEAPYILNLKSKNLQSNKLFSFFVYNCSLLTFSLIP